LLDSAPNVVRAIEQLHRLVRLGLLLEHGGVIWFTVQRFLKTCERVCRVAAFPESFAFLQQLINDRWRWCVQYCDRWNAWLRSRWHRR
jgi:hypothetical protein